MDDNESPVIVCARVTDAHASPFYKAQMEQVDCEYCKVRLIVSPSTRKRITEAHIFACISCVRQHHGGPGHQWHPHNVHSLREALDMLNAERGRQ